MCFFSRNGFSTSVPRLCCSRRLALWLCLSTVLLTTAAAQSREVNGASSTPDANASISGRLLLGDKSVSGVKIELWHEPSSTSARELVKQTVSDAGGRYRFAEVAAGSYYVRADVSVTPAVAGIAASNPGRDVTVKAGETIDDFDLAIERGGVITGRILDANRQPLIEAVVNLHLLAVEKRGDDVPALSHTYRTDDRGVYRIYGLPAGRYQVSVGIGGLPVRLMYALTYPQTFYPGTRDAASAEVIEVREGVEVTGIDIDLGEPLKFYRAKGRVVDAATGAPVANVAYGYGSIRDSNKKAAYGSAMGERRTNGRGEFTLDAVAPGRYAAIAQPEPESEFYFEPAVFEVKDAEVTGIEIKMRRGGSIRGVVVLDDERATPVPEIGINLFLKGPDMLGMLGNERYNQTARDGTFRLVGLRASTMQLSIQQESGLAFLGIEHNGAEVKGEFDIKDGEAISGVRVLMTRAVSVIRGQVRFEEGAREAGRRYVVNAILFKNGEPKAHKSREMDDKGRFVIEDLAAGEYEVTLGFITDAGAPPFWKPVSERVRVPQSAELDVTLVVKRQ